MPGETWWEGRYETDGRSWWDPEEKDNNGHQVIYGYSHETGGYYKKTHRGKRGRPVNARLREALEAREEAERRRDELYEDLNSLKYELHSAIEGRREVEDAITAVHIELDAQKEKAADAEQAAIEEAESNLELQQQVKQLKEELEEARRKNSSNLPTNLKTEQPSSASSSSNRFNKQPDAEGVVKQEPGSEIKKEDPAIVVAFDFHNTLEGWRHRDQRFPIAGSVTNAVQSVIDETVAVEVVSFAIERAQDVLDTLSRWPVFEYLRNVTVLNQRWGAPYEREGEITTGGKDFYLASAGIKVLFDDNPSICSACEAQGILCYRVKAPNYQGEHGSHHCYENVEDAIAAFLAHLRTNHLPFRLELPFFKKEKVPWLESKRHNKRVQCFYCHEYGHKASQCQHKANQRTHGGKGRRGKW